MLGEIAYGLAGMYSDNPGYIQEALAYTRLDPIRHRVNAVAGGLVGLSLGMLIETLMNGGGQPDGTITLVTTLAGAGVCLTAGFPACSEKTHEEYFAVIHEMSQEDTTYD
jgi:hypothetical protein